MLPGRALYVVREEGAVVFVNVHHESHLSFGCGCAACIFFVVAAALTAVGESGWLRASPLGEDVSLATLGAVAVVSLGVGAAIALTRDRPAPSQSDALAVDRQARTLSLPPYGEDRKERIVLAAAEIAEVSVVEQDDCEGDKEYIPTVFARGGVHAGRLPIALLTSRPRAEWLAEFVRRELLAPPR